jgi:predicted enzyme related to lactoylglutathione lyase
MSTAKGKFGWYELMTTDTAAAAAFYTAVIGWNTTEVGSPTMPYTTFNLGTFGIAGLMSLPEAAGPTPGWIGYIHVDNTDAYAAKVVAAGGQIHREPTDVPGMLRFCVVSDPQGAAFVLFTPDPRMPAQPNHPVPPTPGTIGWHELYANDLEPAFDFYSTLFGWTKETDMDMGPAGIYRIFGDGEKQIGGMMKKDANVPKPHWGFYFQVAEINAALERIKAAGGTVVHGPHEVPGGSWIGLGIDPQGASFAVVSTPS